MSSHRFTPKLQHRLVKEDHRAKAPADVRDLLPLVYIPGVCAWCGDPMTDDTHVPYCSIGCSVRAEVDG